MRFQRFLIITPLTLALLLLLPEPASAYLDPASGSIILQVVLGGIAGAGLLIRLYWHKLLRFIGGNKAEHDGSDH